METSCVFHIELKMYAALPVAQMLYKQTSVHIYENSTLKCRLPPKQSAQEYTFAICMHRQVCKYAQNLESEVKRRKNKNTFFFASVESDSLA